MNDRVRIIQLEKKVRRLEKENKELKRKQKYNYDEVRHNAMREGFQAAEAWQELNSRIEA